VFYPDQNLKEWLENELSDISPFESTNMLGKEYRIARKSIKNPLEDHSSQIAGLNS